MTEKTELKTIDAVPVAITPMTLIQQAQAGNATIEQMSQLFDLQMRWEDNEAKKAYFRAVAAFKSETITILKTKHVKFTTQKGTTEYDHEELGKVVKIVIPFLGKHGLSHKWLLEQPEGKVKVTCVMSHELGYSESTTLEGPRDDSGGKNFIQSIKSSVSYLERITFLAITGLAAEGQDDDGKGSEAPQVDVITENQVLDLLGLIHEVKADESKFNAWYKISDVAELPRVKYEAAIKSLESKRTK